jgi:putative hydrolase
MKTWEKYKEYCLTGEWHIHTNYTDGKNSVAEYCEKASKLGIPLIAFTEHVRRELSYDFSKFLADIERARDAYPELIILSGCEAKILPDGELDVDKYILNEVDYPIFAVHSFPPDIDLYIKQLKNVIRNEKVNAWAHPGLFLKRSNLEMDGRALMEILMLMKEKKVLLEVNRKYELPPENWRKLAEKIGVCVVKGSDVHELSELF